MHQLETDSSTMPISGQVNAIYRKYLTTCTSTISKIIVLDNFPVVVTSV